MLVVHDSSIKLHPLHDFNSKSNYVLCKPCKSLSKKIAKLCNLVVLKQARSNMLLGYCSQFCNKAFYSTFRCVCFLISVLLICVYHCLYCKEADAFVGSISRSSWFLFYNNLPLLWVWSYVNFFWCAWVDISTCKKLLMMMQSLPMNTF